VCGVRGESCTECGLGEQLVAIHGYANLSLVVDGSFVEPSHGGAGLVLVQKQTILASRACGFRAQSSSDAEYHAVIRAGRWAPGVAIYTDARDLPVKMTRVNPDLAVHYLNPNERKAAYALAHRLSVEGRCREAPETIPAVGIAFAAERSNLTKSQRRAKGAELLLEAASREPSFDGDFTALAERLGWTSGRRWQDNPMIRIATTRWQELRKLENPDP
jgi:ribonuclease HI